MRSIIRIHIALALGLCHWVGRAQNLDKEMTTLAETLATQVKESGKKKISILDFSDLQGNFNELGRFIAEKLTVKMVSRRKDYSMVDRANLKRILEEHKLTMSGLVDPDNAKKLGQLAGVDAIILGSVIPFKSDVQFTAKIIATDTAEIVGSGEGQVAKDEQITELLGRGISEVVPNSPLGPSYRERGGPKPGQENKKIFLDDDLSVEVISFGFLENRNPSVSLLLKNLNKQSLIRVGLNADQDGGYGFRRFAGFRAFVMDNRGNKAALKKSTGITNPPLSDEGGGETVFKRMVSYPTYVSGFEGFLKPMQVLEVGQVSRCSFEFAFLEALGRDEVGEVFRLEAEIIVAEMTGEGRPKLSLSKVLIENLHPARTNAR